MNPSSCKCRSWFYTLVWCIIKTSLLVVGAALTYKMKKLLVNCTKQDCEFILDKRETHAVRFMCADSALYYIKRKEIYASNERIIRRRQ